MFVCFSQTSIKSWTVRIVYCLYALAYICVQFVDHSLLNFPGRREPKLRPTRQIVPVSQFQKSQTFLLLLHNTGRFIIFSVITNIYNKKTKGPTLMELFTATGNLKKFLFLTTRDVRCVHHG